MIKNEIEKKYYIFMKRHQNILERLSRAKKGTKLYESLTKKFEETEKELFTLYNLRQYILNQLDKDLEGTHY